VNITIYADERSQLQMPEKVVEDPDFIYEMSIKQVQDFTSYQRGMFVFAPNASDIGVYKVGIKMIEIATSSNVISSSFFVIVKSSLSNPNLGNCPSTKPLNCVPRIISVDTYGILTIAFPFSLKTVGPEYFSNVSDSLNITFIPSNTSSRKSNSSITSWNVTEFKPLKLTV
jgi:hypothetical protein